MANQRATEICLCLYVFLPSTGISSESITSNSLSDSGYDIQSLRFARQVWISPALSVVLIHILLMAEHFFSCLLDMYISSFDNYTDLTHVLIVLFDFLLFSFFSSLYCLDINSIPDV